MPTGQAQTRRRMPPMRRGEPEGVADDLAPEDVVAADREVGVVQVAEARSCGVLRVR